MLKSDADGFERYISTAIRDEGVEVEAPFNQELIKKHAAVFALSARFSIWGIYEAFLGSWKRRIRDFDAVIAFDNGLRPGLLSYIKKANPCAKRIAWLWNVYGFEQLARNVGYLGALVDADRIICFDEKYAKANGVEYAHQFYFPKVASTLQRGADIDEFKYDVYFMGSDQSRIQRLELVARELEQQGITHNLILYDPAQMVGLSGEVSFKISNRFLPYEDVLKGLMESRAILDLPKPGQTGLTLRSLEALYFGRKLITSNVDIMDSDLYFKENVFVIGHDSWSELRVFLDGPMHSCGDDLLERYSFADWLHVVTDVGRR